ncbi:response regulator transcription factor [Elizabethkingia meningoseptica]|uniref:DNA-binding response regulator n=1 Tax=Elizabethkingia meningoseptica TaxID=238 RepID=A0A1V3U2C4_ELIME|nr:MULTISPECIES: response regulator transcription factor [Elizabethkingia]AQX06281.1 DNA-binding response regulator [Elizabethkingia meningoseptica]AQX13811.1 DNA-binding response regulator [Elizabethkingia meningoseptica]AQX48330.1 two-component system response regulator [Elizabethkingia meningoseptica]EJK5327283.1 response regulator transcription factor [Elizabethkingia meningoseptica]EOR29344.1 two component transcriptional regulator, LuxR family protein [Elizabethkingia meningoseptica ATCC
MENNSNGVIRFSIADSDFYFKQFLLKMLLENPFYRVVNDCNNGHELISRLYRKQEDVFLINLYMPILSGLEAIKFIRQTNKSTPIITYSATYQSDMDSLLSEIPNTFYCQKNSIVIRDILKNSVLSKKVSFNDYRQEWSQQMLEVQDYMDRQKKSQQDLSLSEIQMIKLCYEGYSNKDIAERMNLSARTVDTYIKRLTEKLGLKSKLDLVRFCVESGYYNTSI